MPRVHVFADESGNFDFSSRLGASKYFILTTITVPTCRLGDELLALRRDLAFEGVGLGNEFHATTDVQAVRDRVFPLIASHDLRVDATIIEKAKAQPSIRETDERFYQHAWYLHMKYLTPRVVNAADELLVVAASLGTRKRRTVFHGAVRDVVEQVSSAMRYQVASWEGASDPCLQAADYCAWAIQRKWESGDSRSYYLIQHLVRTEFDAFAIGSTRYY